MTRREIITNGTRYLESLRNIIPDFQARVIREYLNGEEGEFFHDILLQLITELKDAPRSYQTEGQGDSAKVILHYFSPSSDWWIIELDAEENDYAPFDPNGHHRAFGFVCLNGDTDMAESGYIPIPQIAKLPSVELDFYWDSRTPLWKVKQKLGLSFDPPSDSMESQDSQSESAPTQAERSASPDTTTQPRFRIPNGFLI